jgi:hypothetical protein
MEIVDVLWVQCLASIAFSYYVLFASSEGVRWFSLEQNPFLVVSTLLGVGCMVTGVAFPSATAVFITGLGWSLYAAFVSVMHWPFREWRAHILPVCTPLLALITALLMLY